MDKELKALEKIDNTLCLNNIRGKLDFGIDTEEHTDCGSVTKMTECLDTVRQALTTKIKKEQAFDIIKENFDIEVIVIDDDCYIEITSKICERAKTQRAIKINSKNKDKVEALKEMLENE